MYNKKTLLQAMADMNKAKAPKKPKDIITDPKGQWAHPGEVTRIPSSNITMKGVDYPVLGVANNGQRKMMLPGADYTFPGAEYVDEYPQMQSGGSTIPVIEDAGSFNEDNIWVPDWSKIKEVAKKLGSKTIKTQSGVIIHFDNNWNPKTVDDNPEMKKGGAKKKTKSLSGTNKLFLKHPLFENYKNKVYDPTVDYYQKGGMKTVKSKDGTVTNRYVNAAGDEVVQVKTKDGKYFEKIIPSIQQQKALRDIEDIVKVPFHMETEEEYDKLPADEKLRRFERTVDVNLGYPQARAAQVAKDVTDPDSDPIDNIRHPFAGRYTAEAAYNARKKNASWAPDWLNKAGAWVDANALGVGHEATTLFKDKRPWGTKLRESAEDIYNNAVGVNVGLSDKSEKEKDRILINKSRYNQIPDGFGEEHPFQLSNPKWTDPYDKKQDGGEKSWTEEEWTAYEKAKEDAGYQKTLVEEPKYFDEGMQFVRDWHNSPMYNQMVLNSHKGNKKSADYLTKLRKENIDSIPPLNVKRNAASKDDVAAWSISETGQVEVFPSGFGRGPSLYVHEILHSSDRPRELYNWDHPAYKKHKPSQYINSKEWKNVLGRNNSWTVDKKGNVIDLPDWMIYNDPRFPNENAVWHDRVMPTSDQRYISSHRGANWKDNEAYKLNRTKNPEYYKTLSDEEIRKQLEEDGISKDDPHYLRDFNYLKKSNREEQERINKEEKENWKDDGHDYISIPTEVRARLGEIRYNAKKERIYDPFTEQITPEIFQQYINADRERSIEGNEPMIPINDLRNEFTDEEILWMLQNISKNENPNKELDRAKKGGFIELDLTQKEIEEYRKGGYIVEDISVPELNQAQKGGVKPYVAKNKKDYDFRKKAYDDSLAIYKLEEELNRASLKAANTFNLNMTSKEEPYMNLFKKINHISALQHDIIKNSNVPHKIVPTNARLKGDRGRVHVKPKQIIIKPNEENFGVIKQMPKPVSKKPKVVNVPVNATYEDSLVSYNNYLKRKEILNNLNPNQFKSKKELDAFLKKESQKYPSNNALAVKTNPVKKQFKHPNGVTTTTLFEYVKPEGSQTNKPKENTISTSINNTQPVKQPVVKQSKYPEGYQPYSLYGRVLDPEVYGYAKSINGKPVEAAQFGDTYGYKAKMDEYKKSGKYPWVKQEGGLIEAQKGIISTKEHTDKKGNKTIKVRKEDGTVYTKVIGKDGKVFNKTFDPKKDSWLTDQTKNLYSKPQGAGNYADEFFTEAALLPGAVKGVKAAAPLVKQGFKTMMTAAPSWAPGANLGNFLTAAGGVMGVNDYIDPNSDVRKATKKAYKKPTADNVANALYENTLNALNFSGFGTGNKVKNLKNYLNPKYSKASQIENTFMPNTLIQHPDNSYVLQNNSVKDFGINPEIKNLPTKDVHKFEVTKDEVKQLIDQNLEYLMHPNYIKRRQAVTGESTKKIEKEINKYAENLKKTTIDLNNARYGKKGYGAYLRSLKLLGIPLTKPKILINSSDKFFKTKSDVLHVLDHEIKHALSPVVESDFKALPKYKNYPHLNLVDKKTTNSKYHSADHEQQVRFLRMKDYLHNKYGISKHEPISPEDWDLFKNDWNNWLKEEHIVAGNKKVPRGMSDIKGMMELKDPKVTSDALRNLVNKAWVAAPATGMLMIQNSQNKKQKGGVVTELSDDEIQDYINKGYIVEEVDHPEMQVGGESDLDSQIEAYRQKLELIKSRRAQNPIQETVVETPVKAAVVPSSNSSVQQVVVKKPVIKETVKLKKENPIVKTFEKSKIKQEVKVKTEDTKQKLDKFTKDTLAKIKSQITPTVVPEPNIVNMYKNNYQKHLNSIITDPSKSENLFNNTQLEKEILDRQYIDNVRYGRFDKRGDDVMNRTDFKRNVDSEKYLADIAEDNSVIIDIGSALGNNDPKLSGVSVFELASNPKIKQKNVHVIATDIASGVKDFKNHVKNKTAYDIDYAEVPMNFKTPINKILKDKKLSDKENIYLRTANSIDLLMNVEQTKEHLNHIAKSLKGKTVTYLYNNVILYKPKGKTTFQKLGNINNAGFDHDNKSWLINKNRTPYKLTKPPLR